MSLPDSLKTHFKSPWFLSLLLLGIFLLVTDYKLGWDDQHLEIPLLKHLIDPTLYAGDYYVETAKANFTSYFYPLLAKIISVKQIPTAYFILYLISRYFLFFCVFKLWQLISKNSFHAFLCGMAFILMARVHEFSYRTFSHQEFALAIIFAGIYYFFKDRFILASLLLGIAANFHALYSLFPMIFIGLYLLLRIRKHGIRTLIFSSGIFLLSALPFIMWTLRIRMSQTTVDPAILSNWIELYKLACPQNFFFPPVPLEILLQDYKVLLSLSDNYLTLIALFLLNFLFNPLFRQNKKAIAFCSGAFLLLVLCFVFTYLKPTRLFLDLNLIRNTQYLYFILMGFTTLLAVNTLEKNKPLSALIIALFFTFIKYTNTIALLSTIAMIFTFAFLEHKGSRPNKLQKYLKTFYALLAITCSILIVSYFNQIELRYFVRLNLAILLLLLITNYFFAHYAKTPQQALRFGRLFILIPFCIFLYQFTYYRFEKKREEQTADGFWRLQHSWEDMQRFVKDNTPKNAMILVPYNMEMGGFRIFSERKIVVCYRDCGIVGFSYPAALEWQKRIADIAPFTYSINESPLSSVQNAILKYDADYIVFMRYASPSVDSSLLERIYTNFDFTLFKVVPNPVFDSIKQLRNKGQSI